MAKRKNGARRLYDAFPTAAGARAAARDLNNAPYHPSCPQGAGAVVKVTGKSKYKKQRRLQYGVYVRKSCQVL